MPHLVVQGHIYRTISLYSLLKSQFSWQCTLGKRCLGEQGPTLPQTECWLSRSVPQTGGPGWAVLSFHPCLPGQNMNVDMLKLICAFRLVELE